MTEGKTVSTIGRMTKRERIELLLEHMAEFEDPGFGIGGYGDGGGLPPMMPRVYHHPSVVELRGCLTDLHRCGPKQYQHLKAYYFSEWRTVDRTVKRKATKGKHLTEVQRVRERVVPAWVRKHKVELGVRFVVGRYRGEVYLPNELLAA